MDRPWGSRSLQLLLSVAVSALVGCNAQPMNGAMTPPARPAASGAVADIADPADHATAEAVAWSGGQAVAVGSSGGSDPTPAGANPIFVDGARYHGWLRAIDAHGTVAWTRRLDTGREVHVRAIAPLANDLVIGGEQRSGDARAYTGWVARIAADGSERWRLDRLGEPGASGVQAIAARGDGSVLAGGMSRDKAWLAAIDAHGKPSWQLDLPGLDEVTAMTSAPDGPVIAGVVGRTTRDAGTSRLIAVDATGAARWTTNVPEHGPGELFAIAALAGGGVAVGQAPDAGGRDGAWIVQFTSTGAVRSSQVVPASETEAARAVTAMPDGGFVVAGTSSDAAHGRRGTVWRFDAAGQLRWHQTYASTEALVRGVTATPDGGAIVVGATQAPGATLHAWVFGIDAQGALRWTVP